jgi:hypothetical protein
MYLIDKEKFDAPKEHVKKISFMFVEDNKICDGCDKKRPCASLNAFDGVMIICEDCVTGILNHFNPNLAQLIREDRIERLLK